MRGLAGRQVIIAAIGSMLLSGCWLFPTFPPMESRTYVVENATDTDWVLELRSDFSTTYAIPAGESGTVDDWGSGVEAIVLLDAECATVDELEAADDLAGVQIADAGTLSPLGDASSEGLAPFAEYWQCPGSFGGEPVGVAPLPGATGSVLVVGEDGLLYRYDPASGTVEAAVPGTADTYFDMEHTWSADGSQVAFTRSSETSNDIYVAAADGSGEELVVENGMTPAWSPDGSALAFIDADPFAREPAVMVVDLESGERAEVAGNGSAMSWSPDGTRIAYVGGTSFGSELEMPPSTVHVVNADGTDDREIGMTPPFAYAPVWSPDGTRVAFASVSDEQIDISSYESTISVYDLDAGESTTVAEAEGTTLAEPAWSPDGSSIAFSVAETSIFGGSGSIGIVDAAGGEIVNLGADDASMLMTPAWSPDGAWILASAQDVSTTFDMNLVALDPADPGAEPITLATGVSGIVAWHAE